MINCVLLVGFYINLASRVLTLLAWSLLLSSGSPEITLKFYPEVTMFSWRRSLVGQRGL